MSKNKLNLEQKKAITFGKGPLLIVAGAGTGKTTVLTERIKYLILNNKCSQEEILALTFTEKASLEMQERVDLIMPYGINQMWISTFHSFCERILRAESISIGLDPNFHVMTDSEAVHLIKKNLFNFDMEYFRPLGNPNKFLEGLVTFFSRLSDEDISASDFKEWVNLQEKNKNKSEEDELEYKKNHELLKIYQEYQELKDKEGFLDYGSLISKTIYLFRSRPNILKKYQDIFKYILVDEFQDTNFAQSQLVYLLSGEKGNITVVGDDDQSIYKFRGASVSNILDFRKKYPKANVVVLNKNYRSHQEILDKAYRLIQHNNPDRLEIKENIDKKLTATKKDSSKKNRVFFIHTKKSAEEVIRVLEEIKRLVKDKKYNYSDIAILVRANSHSDAFIKGMQNFDVPVQFFGPSQFFSQKEVVDLTCFFKVLVNPYDTKSLYRVLSIKELEIPQMEIVKLLNYSRKTGISLFESFDYFEEIKTSEEVVAKLNLIRKIIIISVENKQEYSLGKLLYVFLQETNLLSLLLNPNHENAVLKAKNIARFFEEINDYENHNRGANVIDLVDWIDLSKNSSETKDIDESNGVDCVKIMTVHSSKGLEFPIVFMVNLVSQRFPSTKRSDQIPLPVELINEKLPIGDFHVQEERRLFYVGMTRAKDYLYLTAADYYSDKTTKKISPFVFEALGDESFELKTNNKSDIQLTIFESSENVFVGKQDFHIDYLSYSQMETFEICPLHYKLRYQISLGSPQTAQESFGITIHKTMKYIFEEKIDRNTLSRERIEEILNKNWIKNGYGNKIFEKKFFDKGVNFIQEYFKINMNDEPVLLEQPFVIDLVEKKQKSLKIGGTIDRVDLLKDGKIEIIDYKTGEKVPTQKEVDKNEQLTFYALAATMLNDPPFGQTFDKIILSLYFFEKQQKISTTRTLSDLEKFKEKLFSVREKIENSDFKCSKHYFCQDCEYLEFCSQER